MKKIIILIFVIAITITTNSCNKKKYYACCDTGHSHWEGSSKWDSPEAAQVSVKEHDDAVHGGVKTASVCK